jgi:hypothetical protein
MLRGAGNRVVVADLTASALSAELGNTAVFTPASVIEPGQIGAAIRTAIERRRIARADQLRGHSRTRLAAWARTDPWRSSASPA